MARTEISALGKIGLAKRLTDGISPKNTSTAQGVGDDCAVMDFPKSRVLATSGIMLEGVHFNLTYVPLRHLGYKAVVRNISAICAMNGKPRQIMVNLGVGSRFCVENIEELYSGIRYACERYGVDIAGSDTSPAYTGLCVATTCIGEAESGNILYRSGARENDLVCVSGNLGAAYMGLQLLEREKRVFEEQSARAKSEEARLAVQQPDFAGREYLLERQLKPEARTDILERLDKAGVRPTAMAGISDGLASELMHICEQSGAGCRVYEERVPVDYQTASLAEEIGINPITAAMNGGEDYELLFTVPLADYEKVSAIDDVHVIGNITAPAAGQVLVARDGAEFGIKAQGWNASADK